MPRPAVFRRRPPVPAAALLAAAVSIIVAGCSGLRPLPEATLPPCAPGGVGELWACLDAVPLAGREESAFRSTQRAADLGRKRRDQSVSSACEGAPPAGFEAISGVETEPGRPPLFAHYRPPRPGRPSVIVVHGLYDSKNTRYVRVTAEALAAAGYGVLVPDMRWHGCLLSSDWLPAMGIEEGADLIAWAGWLRRRHPDSAVGLVGFSLGALAVVHAAGGPGGETLTAGTVAVSPPAALERTFDRLDSRSYWSDRGALVLIDRFFRRTLKRRMRDLGVEPGPAPFAELLAWRAERSPPPLGPSAEGLLRLADPGPKIAAARRPLLLISARVDPVFSGASPADLATAAATNPMAHLIETAGGGHIGHPGTYPRWFTEVLVRFFDAAPRTAPASP